MAGRYLTIKQLAERVGVSPSVIRRHDAALRPLRLNGRDRRYTEAHIAQAHRLLLVPPGDTKDAQSGRGQLTAHEPETLATSWKNDPAMAWTTADLSGEPLPPDATRVATYERQEAEEERRAAKALQKIVRVKVPAAFWQELDTELADDVAQGQTP